LYVNLNWNAQTSSVLVLTTCLVCAIIITSLIPFNKFSECYINIIKICCITSWMYLIPLKFELLSILPDFYSLADLRYSNFLFFGIMRPDYPDDYTKIYYTHRNSGIFWEPGAFQIFINLAFYFDIIRRSNSVRNLIIFGITIITTSSTAGIFVYFLLLTVYLIENKKLNKKYIFATLSLLISLLIYNQEHLKKFEKNSNESISTQSRYMDILLDKSLITKNYLFGIGYGNLEERDKEGREIFPIDYETEKKPTGSNGITLLIAYLGLYMGSIIIFLILFPKYISKFNLLTKFLLVLSTAAMFSSQNMFTYILPWILIIYGIQSK
jgi:hypothetical protein